jgi:hypothetical protein
MGEIHLETHLLSSSVQVLSIGMKRSAYHPFERVQLNLEVGSKYLAVLERISFQGRRLPILGF